VCPFFENYDSRTFIDILFFVCREESMEDKRTKAKLLNVTKRLQRNGKTSGGLWI
jgi:hypothetical protein